MENPPPRSEMPNADPLFIRALAHPLLLLVASLASIVLWIPYGFGYYEYPWRNRLARWSLQLFAIAFPLLAGVSIANSIKNRSFGPGFVVAILSLVIGSFGCFSMAVWTMTYVWLLED